MSSALVVSVLRFHPVPSGPLSTLLGGESFTGVSEHSKRPPACRPGNHSAIDLTRARDDVRRELGLPTSTSGARLCVARCTIPRQVYSNRDVAHTCAAPSPSPSHLVTVRRASYGATQPHFKFHPDFDAALIGVLEADPGAVLVLLSEDGRVDRTVVPRLARTAGRRWCGGAQSAGHDVHGDGGAREAPRLPDPPPLPPDAVHLLRDWTPPAGRGEDTRGCEDAAAAAVRSRVVLLPRLNHPAFLRMLGALDVCLDLWPFGGGFATYETLVLAATPVVTLPSGVRSGRLTLATLRRLGLADPVRRLCPCS